MAVGQAVIHPLFEEEKPVIGDCECLACGQPAAVIEDDVLLCGDCFLEHTLRVLQAEDPRVRMMIGLELQPSA